LGDEARQTRSQRICDEQACPSAVSALGFDREVVIAQATSELRYVVGEAAVSGLTTSNGNAEHRSALCTPKMGFSSKLLARKSPSCIEPHTPSTASNASVHLRAVRSDSRMMPDQTRRDAQRSL